MPKTKRKPRKGRGKGRGRLGCPDKDYCDRLPVCGPYPWGCVMAGDDDKSKIYYGVRWKYRELVKKGAPK